MTHSDILIALSDRLLTIGRHILAAQLAARAARLTHRRPTRFLRFASSNVLDEMSGDLFEWLATQIWRLP